VQIILVHSGLKQARTLTLSMRHLVLAVVVTLTVLLFGSSALSYATLRFGAVLDLPILRDIVRSTTVELAEKRDGQLRDHLNAMAIKLGEMQAQMNRLNVIGERVTSLVGIKPQEYGFGATPGRGGASPGADARDMTMNQLKGDLATLEADVSNRTQDMNRLESTLLDQRVAKRLMPSAQPVNDGFVGSGFGWRTDPFTGKQVRHDGIDFAAPVGTPILAAAGGVVVAAEFHPEFGNMVDVDHGNGILTRYAHASRLLVKAGDIVKRGDHLADVGSTGRSTGPHLHFEVHVNGVPQNPTKFLADGGLRQVVTASK
jgi:murein DD-endopeptidase MepM/ murein hydrolase activator NlpD